LPTLDILEQIAHYLGVRVGAFFDEEPDAGEKPDDPHKKTSLLELINRLNKERYARKIQEERVLELEKLTEHLMYVNELQAKLISIFNLDLPKPERTKKTEALAKETIKSGKLRVNEVQAILQLGRSEMKHLMEPEKAGYQCRIFDDKAIMASNPGEAGMWLGCFDCDVRAKRDCEGYGEDRDPEDNFELMAMLGANGIFNRDEQAKLLHDLYGSDLSAHQISEMLSRKKHGKPVSEDMKVRRRK
jgi:transcriptional regulator with XRE-family HTH domain